MKYILTITVMTLFVSINLQAQTPSNLIIKEYGTISDLEDVVDPDQAIDYKIVIDLKAPSPDPATINPGLNNIARMLNLHAAGGIDAERLKVVAAIHGNATYTVLNNAGYKAKYGIENPNLDLIKQLNSAGVQLFICSQSLVARNSGLDNVNPDIEIALSMLTVVTEHQMKGFGLLVFQ